MGWDGRLGQRDRRDDEVATASMRWDAMLCYAIEGQAPAAKWAVEDGTYLSSSFFIYLFPWSRGLAGWRFFLIVCSLLLPCVCCLLNNDTTGSARTCSPPLFAAQPEPPPWTPSAL